MVDILGLHLMGPIAWIIFMLALPKKDISADRWKERAVANRSRSFTHYQY